MRILYITTIGLTMMFFKDLIRELIEGGNTVDIATNETEYAVDNSYREMGCNITQIDFSRSPFDKENIKAFKQLKELLSANHYDIVHCHTPVAAVITRLAARKLRRQGLRVIYTAHGFHFYKGAPLRNWLMYFPVELICSRFTDVLITINHEDFEFAQKHMWAKQVEYVPGVGVDIERFANARVDRAEKRRELGIPEDAFLLMSVGELNENKNHQIVIRALAELNEANIHYMIAGEGYYYQNLLCLAHELGVASQVHLLGQRNDVAELFKTADVNVFPSIREGLGLAALEGMAAGLPLVCTDNRGTREYAINGYNAFVCSNSVDEYSRALRSLYCGGKITAEYGSRGALGVGKFDYHIVIEQMMRIYI